MQARSIVFDLFGDYIRDDGGAIPLRDLVTLLGSFGISPDSARVIMSRVTREGWFQSTKHGRESVYQPTPRGWTLLDKGLQRIMSPPSAEKWDQLWYMVVFSVPEQQRAARARLRTTLSWLGFAPMASAVWISPRDRLDEAEEALRAEEVEKYDLFAARSRGPREDLERVEQGWDLGALARDYQNFSERCATILAGNGSQMVGEEALVTRTQLIHDYRMFLFRDPGLPLELLPEQWPALNAYDEFIAAIDALLPAAQEFYRSLRPDPQLPTGLATPELSSTK